MMPRVYEVIRHLNAKKGRKKNTRKIRAHPWNRPGASGFLGRHANY